MASPFAWDHLRAFLRVAEAGSLTAAAEASGVSQPTLGRHVCALEAALGVTLFLRTGQGLVLTETGTSLLGPAREMAAAANHVSLTAEGRAENLAGTVRITASRIVAHFLLPDLLTTLRQSEPDIDIDLVASDQTENLLKREADIALRMYRPNQSDVIARKIGGFQVGMFAAHSYIARQGRPETPQDLLCHDVIGYDRDDQIIEGFRNAGFPVTRDFFAIRSDDQVVCWQMVVAGFGIGFNQLHIGAREPRVEHLDLTPLPSLPIWLVAHSELRHSARVRRVFDYLAETLREYADVPA